MLNSIRLLIAVLFLAPLAASAGESVVSGKISDTGWGKFILKEAGGLERTYAVGRRATSYEPSDWRPAAGDQVKVDWYEKKGKLVAGKVTLVKLGANSIDPASMKSPLIVKVTEAGRSGIKAIPEGKSTEIKFTYQRKHSKFEPTGWNPQAGERVRVDFEAKKGKFSHGLTYAINKLTLIK